MQEIKQLNAMPTDTLEQKKKTVPAFNDNNLSSCIFLSHNVVVIYLIIKQKYEIKERATQWTSDECA